MDDEDGPPMDSVMDIVSGVPSGSFTPRPKPLVCSLLLSYGQIILTISAVRVCLQEALDLRLAHPRRQRINTKLCILLSLDSRRLGPL